MDAAAVVEHKPAVAPVEGAPVLCETKPSAVKEDTIVNRETKLALLIGFVAIVVVTVLVGEHFGKARNQNPATTDLGTSAAAAPSNTGLTVDPITAAPVATPSAPLMAPINGAGAGAPVQPVVINTSEPGLTRGPEVAAANPNVFMPAAGIETNLLPPSAGTLDPQTGIPGTQPAGMIGDREVPAPSPITLSPAGNRPTSSGVEKMHPVVRGDTLSVISQRYYGTKAYAKELGAYNAKRLSSNGTIREGVTLRIPPKDVLMGDAVLSPTNAGRTESPAVAARGTDKPAAPKATTEKPKATGPRTYVIKKGDTLMTIAAKELGSAKRWESLLVANPGLDENSLRTGRSIKIPSNK